MSRASSCLVTKDIECGWNSRAEGFFPLSSMCPDASLCVRMPVLCSFLLQGPFREGMPSVFVVFLDTISTWMFVDSIFNVASSVRAATGLRWPNVLFFFRFFLVKFHSFVCETQKSFGDGIQEKLPPTPTLLPEPWTRRWLLSAPEPRFVKLPGPWWGAYEGPVSHWFLPPDPACSTHRTSAPFQGQTFKSTPPPPVPVCQFETVTFVTTVLCPLLWVYLGHVFLSLSHLLLRLCHAIFSSLSH